MAKTSVEILHNSTYVSMWIQIIYAHPDLAVVASNPLTKNRKGSGHCSCDKQDCVEGTLTNHVHNSLEPQSHKLSQQNMYWSPFQETPVLKKLDI